MFAREVRRCSRAYAELLIWAGTGGNGALAQLSGCSTY